MPNIVTSASVDQNLALAKQCSREAALAGFKAAAIGTIASAIPTLASVRLLPWAKANINPAGQALIISTVAGMAYFIAADKKILALARQHSYENAPEHLLPGHRPSAPRVLQAVSEEATPGSTSSQPSMQHVQQ